MSVYFIQASPARIDNKGNICVDRSIERLMNEVTLPCMQTVTSQKGSRLIERTIEGSVSLDPTQK